MEGRSGIVWFRNDLRIHDNEALIDALNCCEKVIPIYIFDERQFGTTTPYGFPKTGAIRTQFIIQSIKDLRQRLRGLGSDLIVRVGKSEEIIFELTKQYKCSWVFCNRERTQEEVEVQDALEKQLWTMGQEMRYTRGKMLFYTADLPFPITHVPDVFTQFRKEVERFVDIRKPFEIPEKMPAVPEDLPVGNIPNVTDFGLEHQAIDDRAVLSYQGGETAGLKRLNYYFKESHLPETYKETRNEMLGGDYSTKFSAWLAQGCLSPKKIYYALKDYEANIKKNKSTYWIFFELMWRDFFRFMAKKYGNVIFQKGGLRRKALPELKNNRRILEIWKDAKTGIPFIDANMREIALTGFMSNRGRQNVASFLINDLKVNWIWGAEYFESQLIDYDVASNWGNWNYLAGVGNDPREDRVFNILKQAQRYDADGDYVKYWLPELANVPSDRIHRPDTWTKKEQAEWGVKLGVDYPKPMVSIGKWE